jgi:hypothetical protein
MGHPERGYCFRRGGDALLMWDGYFSDLMRSMWRVYGWEADPDDAGHAHVDQVPLLQEWNEGLIGTHRLLLIAELPAMVKALHAAVADLRRAGPNLAESPQHGEALIAFLEGAVAAGQAVSVEEWWR